jgi:hypothetical protein
VPPEPEASVFGAEWRRGVAADVVVNGDDGSGLYGQFGPTYVTNTYSVSLFLQGGPISFDSLTNVASASSPAFGNVILNGVTLTVGGDNTNFRYDGSITGSGGLAKVGGGTMTLVGTDSAGGGTTIGKGSILVSGSITGGGVTVNNGFVQPDVASALAGATVTVNVPGGLDLSALSAATVGGLAGTGDIGMGANVASARTLTVGSDNVDTQYDGVLMGSGSLVKAGYGNLTVSALNSNPAMGATVNDGFLNVTGTFDLATPSTITVPVGGTLDGVTPAGVATYSIDGILDVSGTFGAGTPSSPGQLSVHRLNMAPANATPGTFSVRLNGTTAGTQYDQVNVFGPVNLGTGQTAATLNLMPGMVFPTGSNAPVFDVIREAANNPIIGTFAELANNGIVCAGGQYFRIGYTSTDVTLTPIPTPDLVVQVNDGNSNQRSEVRSITVTLKALVTFVGDPAAAFTLLHVQDSAYLNNLHATVSTDAGNTIVTLTFTTFQNAPTEVDPISAENGGAPSLADGRYTLSTGTYTSPTDTLGGTGGQLHLYRLFGDSDGDGVVNQTDVNNFNAAYGTSSSSGAYRAYLDADNNGLIDSFDQGLFNANINRSVFS